jgi:hypothetical protein
MSDPLYMQKQYQTANAPKVHPLIKRSFVFMHSAGVRSAPEILILEMMREVFFEQHYGDETRARDINPDERNEEGINSYTKENRAVLYALSGRRKRNKTAIVQKFYAPAYPQLAEKAWFRKNSDRVVKDFLLSGPVAQYLTYNKDGPEGIEHRRQDIANKIQHALIGGNSCLDNNLTKKEILAVTLGPTSFEKYKDRDFAVNNISDKCRSEYLISIQEDELAKRITQDLIAICDLEPQIPRMQWLQLLMTFLRFALPMWFLSQMQITRLVHEWLLKAVEEGGCITDEDVIFGKLASRNRKLLHPTLTPTRELFEHIDRYMKCRVELDILLYCLSEVKVGKVDLLGNHLSLNLDGGGKGWISVENLLIMMNESSSQIRALTRFKEIAGDSDVKTFLTREGEQFSSWRNPRKGGQGKNIDEFFRVLYHADKGDESGGYLLTSEGQAAKRGFKVFPGQLLLKTMTFLAAKSKWSNIGSGSGMLVLQDVEDHFAQYGIDFSNAADARPLLMEKLQEMGLLKGTTDAGSSVAVLCPY